MVKFVETGNIPSSDIKSKSYVQFKGVDYSTAQTKIDPSRSPDALNVIIKDGGIIKRLGWSVVENFNAPVNGIFKLADNHFLIHAGTSLYKFVDGVKTDLNFTVPDNKSMAVNFENNLYILTGNKYVKYDGENITKVTDDAFTPTTSINGIDPMQIVKVSFTSGAVVSTYDEILNGGKAYAGDSFQYVNLLSPKRKNTFITAYGKGKNRNYEEFTEKTQYLVLDGACANVISVRASNGTSQSNNITVTHYDEYANVVTDIAEAKYSILYRSSGFGVYASISEGEITNDTVTVEYEAYRAADFDNNIDKCTIMAIYANRIFFAGNPDKPNYDWASELNDPSYIPDLSYNAIGNDTSAIMGYLRMGDYLAIIKEDNSQDATVFLRSYDLAQVNDLLDADAVFPVKQGIAGNGAVSKYCFCNLLDDPLFLTRLGVFALASQNITSERVMQVRSTRVNSKLTAEENLQNAVATEWNGYFLLFVNGHAYVADSRQRSYTNNTTGTFEYEWVFWDNIPAVSVYEDKGKLFFGTVDGELCAFNDDTGQMSVYADDYKIGAAVKEKTPIIAYWSTPKEDDGTFMTFKTMPKRGCGVYLKTFTRSSVSVAILTDRDLLPQIVNVNTGIFDFNDIDFEHFTFNTLPQAVVPFNTKVKKYKTIQIIIKNDVLNEGFGVYGIERKIVYGNYVK